MAATYDWRLDERNKINAMIRKAHKTALGLLDCTSTEKLLDLGVHNTLGEIGKEQRASQLVRLAETKTGRAIPKRLGVDPHSIKDGYGRTGGIPNKVRRRMTVYLIPKNMSPNTTGNGERRERRQWWNCPWSCRGRSTSIRRSFENARRSRP